MSPLWRNVAATRASSSGLKHLVGVDGRIHDVADELGGLGPLAEDVNAGAEGQFRDLEGGVRIGAVVVEDHFLLQVERGSLHTIFEDEGGLFKGGLAADAGFLADGIDEHAIHKGIERGLIAGEFDFIHAAFPILQRKGMRSVEQLVAVAFGVEFAEDFEGLGHEAVRVRSEMTQRCKPGVAGCAFPALSGAMSLTLLPFRGAELSPHLDALGTLRITVFREYPYLYDGSLDYERDYLQCYLRCPRSLVVLAFDGDKVVGATTCMPMSEEGPEFQAAFRGAGYDLETICYFGESILLPAYRGHGLGKAFFAHREAHARAIGAQIATFCAVDRPADHPLRPAGYRPLDAFWQAQGYKKHPEFQATFVWKEIGEETESPKTLTFWLKHLEP